MYTIELYNLDLIQNQIVKIAVLNSFTDLSFSNELNEIGTCSFRINLFNENADFGFVIPKKTQVVVKKDGIIRFLGPVSSIICDYVDVKGQFIVQAYSYLYHLKTRFSPSIKNFVATEQTAIAWSLIDEVQSRVMGNLFISNGATTTNINRNLTLEYKCIADYLIQQSDNINGFDFDFLPITNQNGNLTGVLFKTYYPQRGTNLNNVIFSLETNISEFGFELNDDFANHVIARGAGFGDPITFTAFDNNLMQSYTRAEKIANYSDVSVLSTLQSKAENLINIYGQPKRQIRIKLRPDRKPLLWEDYDLGDIVQIKLTVPDAKIKIQNTARLLKYDVFIDQNGVEFVTPTLSIIN